MHVPISMRHHFVAGTKIVPKTTEWKPNMNKVVNKDSLNDSF